LAAAYAYFVTSRENSHRSLIVRGDVALADGDPSTAIELFSGAIALRGDAMIGYLKRGEAYRRRDDLEAALRDLRRASELDPSATRPRELLGDVNFARSRFVPAAEHYEAYVRLDDNSPRVLYKLALARYRAGQPAVAITWLTKAVALDDHFPEAYYLLGLCQREAQKPAAALASLNKAISLDRTMVPAREELADLLETLGRDEDAIAQREALRVLDPNTTRDVTLGLAYASAGQIDRAIATLRHAAGRQPSSRVTYVALGRVWLDAAQARDDGVDLGKAIEALEYAVNPAFGQETSEGLMLLGRALLLKGDVERAEHVLNLSVEKLPIDPQAFYYLAEAAERRTHVDAARRALLDYVSLVGDDPDARRRAALAARIGDLSMRLEDNQMAVAYYERAAVFQNDVDFLVKYADARSRINQTSEARAILSRALEKDPTHPAGLALKRRLR
jgi:tetratricopeptide (TPR) repeat protein